MADKRDRIEEILAAKARSSRSWLYQSFNLERLMSDWKDKEVLPDFFLIRAVTLLEVFTRGKIAALVDYGSEYAKRGIQLAPNLKLDFELVTAVQGRAITLGDIVAHSVAVNRFGQILGYFEVLLDRRPLEPVLSSITEWTIGAERQTTPPVIPDIEALKRTLSRLFQVRHIIVHETPKKPAYALNEVEDFLVQSSRFVRAMEQLLQVEMYSFIGLTQGEMNTHAAKELSNKKEELNEVVSAVKSKMEEADGEKPGLMGAELEGYLQSLDTAQERWLAYRDAECDFDVYPHRHGTIRPTLWMSNATTLTEARISDLRAWLARRSDAE